MLEFVIRGGIAVSLVAWAAIAGALLAADALVLAVSFAAVAYCGFYVHQRGLLNPGIAGILAVLESFILAFGLGEANMLSTFGFLVLAPLIWSAGRHSAPVTPMAPLAAAGMIAANNITRDASPDALLYGQAVAVLAVGLLLGRFSWRAPETPLVPKVPEETAIPLHGAPNETLEAHLELRENYRKLRDAYTGLEEELRKQCVTQILAELAPTTPKYLVHAVRALARNLSVESMALYRPAEFEKRLVVQVVHGEATMVDSLSIDPTFSPDLIAAKAEEAMRALRKDGPSTRNVVVTHEGRVQAVVTLADHNADRLAQAYETLERGAEAIGAALVAASEHASTQRRLRETDLLYRFSSAVAGAQDSEDIAKRFVRELVDLSEADHAGVYMIENESLAPLAVAGQDVRLLERMSFACGSGVRGWAGVQGPELPLFDVSQDERCPNALALRQRIGAYLVVPMEEPEGLIGCVSLASGRTGGLDLGHLETLRMLVPEFHQCLARLEGRPDPMGVLNTQDFRAWMDGKEGTLVQLQVLRREKLVEVAGRAEVEQAVRVLVRRIRARLPEKGAVTRLSNGDLLAFLPGVDPTFGERWTNEAAATASLIGLRRPDGMRRIPLAIRGKVANLDSKPNEVYANSHA